VIVPRRLFEKNGVEYFIRALPLIRRELDVEAVLVGDGPERERLEALARNWASRLRDVPRQPAEHGDAGLLALPRTSRSSRR
jgi:glycosyltransferase involved in cell wall biosynthesis